MAVNQAQVDNILTGASADDPEVKLQNLEREVDLIKTSIKRLLMDIRERMNELENPFTITVAGGGGEGSKSSAESEAKMAALEAKEAALEAREAELSAAKTQVEAQKVELEKAPAATFQQTAPAAPQFVPQPAPAAFAAPQPVAMDERRIVDEQLLAQFKAQLMGSKPSPERASAPQPSEKFRLQKVYKLFKWTTQAVRKYGHDRLEIMLQSYKTMGYISKESADEIREIARLMPANLGDEHEVGPDEFVSELYTLNRIIAPDDTTLDRDMIEVMMEQRSQMLPAIPAPSPARIEFPRSPAKEKKPAKESDYEEDWMNLPDRI